MPPSDEQTAPAGAAGAQAHAGHAEVFRRLDFTTDHVAESERLEFLHAATGKRMECAPAQDGGIVSVHVRGFASGTAEFLDYRARGISMNRTAALCEDGRDEISLGLVIGNVTGAAQNDRELRLQRGDLYAIDFGRPVRSLVPDHHELAITLPRRDVAALRRSRAGDREPRALCHPQQARAGVTQPGRRWARP